MSTKQTYYIEELDLYTWFERDRACVELRTKDGQTVFEVWDDDCRELIEDGFLDSRNFKQSAFNYARELGLIS